MNNDEPTLLWNDLISVTAALQGAIRAEDSEQVDALLRRRDLLLSTLRGRDLAADLAADPFLTERIAQAQAEETTAEQSFAAAQNLLEQKLTAMQQRRAALRAGMPPATPAPRFCDHRG